MPRLDRRLLRAALTAAGVLALLSIVPGLLATAGLIVLPVAAILAAIFLPVALYVAIRRRGCILPTARPRLRTWSRLLTIAAVTAALLVTRVPLRLAFEMSRRGFQFEAAPPPEKAKGDPIPFTAGFVGLYYVDRWAEDERGGVYFRTFAAPNLLGPTTSHGFSYRPNPDGSPFGDDGYATSALGWNWYVFVAASEREP